jgi:hypothetical protein
MLLLRLFGRIYGHRWQRARNAHERRNGRGGSQNIRCLSRSGEADILQAAIERGVPSNLRNERGDSLIMLAAYHGHADAVARLLALKADRNLRSSMGQTPLA